MNIPTRKDVEIRLIALITGNISREQISEWASQWTELENPPLDDQVVWNTLEALSGADSKSTDRPYLFNKEDFEDWLDDLKNTP